MLLLSSSSCKYFQNFEYTKITKCQLRVFILAHTPTITHTLCKDMYEKNCIERRETNGA